MTSIYVTPKPVDQRKCLVSELFQGDVVVRGKRKYGQVRTITFLLKL